MKSLLQTCGLESCRKKDTSLLDVYFLRPFTRKESCSKSIRIENIYEIESWLAWQGCVPKFERKEFENFVAVDKKDYDFLKQEIETFERQRLQKTKWIHKRPDFAFDTETIFVEKVKIPKNDKILVIGDLHCSLTSMLHILSFWYENKWIQNDFVLAPQFHLIFLGDIIDRGAYGTELITLIFLLKRANKNRVYSINGNHETCETFLEYGMQNEIEKKFGLESLSSLLQHMSFLQYQPSAIFLEYGDERFQFSHGAFTSNIGEQENIKQLLQSDKNFLFLRDYSKNLNRIRASNFDEQKWGDFIGTKEDTNSLRGKNMKTFGWRSTLNYLKKLNITAIISGHQDLSNFTMLLSPFCSKRAKELDFNYKTLYRPLNYGEKNFSQKVTFEPGKDFIAVNTSTAIDSKPNIALQYDCFAVLKK